MVFTEAVREQASCSTSPTSRGRARWLAAWAEAGGTVVSGLEMLLHQAIEQVRIFVTGADDAAARRRAARHRGDARVGRPLSGASRGPLSWKDGRMLRWLTAGESHGPELVAILEGLPAGVPITPRGDPGRPRSGASSATAAARA